jgi:hypothetical protein
MYRLLICFAFILAIFTAAQAQRNFSATVQVQVVSSPDTPANDMAKSLEKELGAYVDISIKPKSADYLLQVFLERVPTGSGPNVYAEGYNFFRHAECTYKNPLVDGKVVRPDCNALVRFSTIAFITEAQLKDKAKETVNTFNQLVVDPDRKAYTVNRSY